MSQENAELIRDFYAAWDRGDIQFILDRCDPHVEIVQPSELPDATSYHGLEGVREAFEDWPRQWGEFEVELVRVVDADEHRTISVNRQRLGARGLGLEQEVVFLHTFKDGLATRVDMFFSVDQAREAADVSR